MNPNIEMRYIQTVRPGGGHGIRIPANAYRLLEQTIFNHLLKNENVTTVDLLTASGDYLADQFNDNDTLNYMVLQVKLDLEARGYLRAIKSATRPLKTQKCIGITRSGFAYFKLNVALPMER